MRRDSNTLMFMWVEIRNHSPESRVYRRVSSSSKVSYMDQVSVLFPPNVHSDFGSASKTTLRNRLCTPTSSSAGRFVLPAEGRSVLSERLFF